MDAAGYSFAVTLTAHTFKSFLNTALGWRSGLKQKFIFIYLFLFLFEILSSNETQNMSLRMQKSCEPLAAKAKF